MTRYSLHPQDVDRLIVKSPSVRQKSWLFEDHEFIREPFYHLSYFQRSPNWKQLSESVGIWMFQNGLSWIRYRVSREIILCSCRLFFWYFIAFKCHISKLHLEASLRKWYLLKFWLDFSSLTHKQNSSSFLSKLSASATQFSVVLWTPVRQCGQGVNEQKVITQRFYTSPICKSLAHGPGFKSSYLTSCPVNRKMPHATFSHRFWSSNG